MQAVQLVGCGVIGAALAVLLVSVCFWLAVRVGGVICCGGGFRLEGVARAGDRAGGPLLIRQAVTAQAGQIGQVVTVGGAVLPCADRGGGSPSRC